MNRRVYGNELRPGDTIAVAWQPYSETIKNIMPYDRTVGAASLATFKGSSLALTVIHSMTYKQINL
jgi:hypothetical protein